MDFSVVVAFGMVLEAGSILVLVNLSGIGGARTLRVPTDLNVVLPVISRFKIVLAAFETLQHTLDF